MKYQFELTLSIKAQSEGKSSFDVQSFDKLQATSLIHLFSQFLVLVGSIHRRMINDCKMEGMMIDDDIPF